MANLEAPMAGKILEISVKVGDTIAEDDEIAVIEALKMENPIFAAEGGTVTEIVGKEGSQVSEGDVLVILG
jgi:acetyl-CoA carboxylase biotin carboxyl carrier protein